MLYIFFLHFYFITILFFFKKNYFKCIQNISDELLFIICKEIHVELFWCSDLDFRLGTGAQSQLADLRLGTPSTLRRKRWQTSAKKCTGHHQESKQLEGKTINCHDGLSYFLISIT